MATELLSKLNSHEEGQQTHSVASEAVGNCVRVCIAFRVWKQNLNAVLTDCLHLDNCTRSDSIGRPVAKRSNGGRKRDLPNQEDFKVTNNWSQDQATKKSS